MMRNLLLSLVALGTVVAAGSPAMARQAEIVVVHPVVVKQVQYYQPGWREREEWRRRREIEFRRREEFRRRQEWRHAHRPPPGYYPPRPLLPRY